MKHFAFRNQLQIAWNSNVNGSVAFNLTNKQQRTRKRLSHWNKVEFGDIDKNINNLEIQLENAQNDLFNDSQHENIVAITKKLDDWFNIKEDFYKQKSGDSFITEIDHNTKYFHTLANRRMSRKNIDYHCDTNGVWFSDSKDMANLLVDHFSQVSKTIVPVFTDITFDIIPTIITEHDSSLLTRIPNSDDVHQIIKHMSAWSSPGPDGFQAVYKVISKIIADRIKPFLKHLISSYQAAFVPGRDIHDNIIVAHEMIHTMKHKEGYSGTMALKLDLSKAFDRIEWSFLLGIHRQFGFDAIFCGYIEQCISTTNISVLLNGSPTQIFSPTRGIRQDDPLSPYLFILCMEFLSRLILNAETNHLISGVKAARKAPGITHLMFDDDILIFTKADMHNKEGIMNVLNYFSSVSGQMLNLDKSSVYFSHNISPSTREILARELKMTEMKDSDKYLGVTLLIGRDKTKAFKPLIKSFGTRLKFWKGKTMNRSARTTMVKHVLNALPTYQMGCFKIPKTMIDQMESIQKHFWWGHSDNKGLCMIGWNKLNIPKALGGLGFRNLEHFNTALLTKIAWKACNDDNSLLCRLLWLSMARMVKIILSGHQIGETKTPNRVQLFIWKCLRDIVPVRGKLVSYKSDIDSKCSLCSNSTETISHLLVECTYARSIWNALNVHIADVTQNFVTLQDWIISWFYTDADVNKNINYISDSLVFKLMCAVWYIWKDRCSWIFQSEKPNMNRTLSRIHNLVKQCEFSATSSSVPRNRFILSKIWFPPGIGYIKVNIDASYDYETRKGSIGLIVRDHAGYALAAK
ncbi:uncharacterized protein LOC113332111 [Papaver somniferum]|uniref:uncharacterized protein LOC113332111 n=1 Tax=Papaver somniferum TaxID=3469 RepID=UPI000E6FA81A|nr:uncharacterized protein LOC113332111 [Papaver somniferum]